MASSTIFKNFTIPVEKKSLLLIGKDIISDKYKTEVEEIRNLIAQGNKGRSRQQKETVISFYAFGCIYRKKANAFS
jgi:hypothetical protein